MVHNYLHRIQTYFMIWIIKGVFSGKIVSSVRPILFWFWLTFFVKVVYDEPGISTFCKNAEYIFSFSLAPLATNIQRNFNWTKVGWAWGKIVLKLIIVHFMIMFSNYKTMHLILVIFHIMTLRNDKPLWGCGISNCILILNEFYVI